MAATLCVNMSTVTIPIFDNSSWSDPLRHVIGEIHYRDAFVVEHRDTWSNVWFSNRTGTLSYGFILHYNLDGTPSYASQNGANVFRHCDDSTIRYGTATINGTTYSTFKMNKRANLYTGDGTAWTDSNGRNYVQQGMRVATTSSSVGATHRDWKSINYVETSSGVWQKISSTNYPNNGFVDTGLANGETPSLIALYGRW